MLLSLLLFVFLLFIFVVVAKPISDFRIKKELKKKKKGSESGRGVLNGLMASATG